MLIFEGGDGLGKSTAAKRIVELVAEQTTEEFAYPVRYAHMTRQNKHFDFFTHYRDMISLYAVQDRFHIGALAYHDNVMCEAQLRVIEGWLASLGSLTVIFVAEDTSWYSHHLANSLTPHMFSDSALLKANDKYRDIVRGNCNIVPHIDEVFDVSSGWPSDETLMELVKSWFGRIRYAEC